MTKDAELNADKLEEMLSRFAHSGEPISLSFRDLVAPDTSGPRLAHQIHRYPAKLLVHIPHFLICNDLLSSPNGVTLDPFCGSGTVLLESLLAGRNAVGADSNPLARLVATVKTTPLRPYGLRASAQRLLERARREQSGWRPDVPNLDYWFHPHTITQLAQIRTAISRIRSEDYRNFFLVCLSACARQVSLADPRVSVPVRLKDKQYPPGHWLREKTDRLIRQLRVVNVHRVFERILLLNIERVCQIEQLLQSGCSARIVGSDARTLDAVGQASVDLVVTSPPYMGAQKYIRSVSLGLMWIGLDGASNLKELERACLGREHFRKEEYSALPETGILPADRMLRQIFGINALRAYLAANYLIELRKALRETTRTLRPGGHLVLVCSNNTVAGRTFHTQEHLRSILADLGLMERLRIVDTIRSRGLMTKRNKTASVISREWVLLYQKPEDR